MPYRAPIRDLTFCADHMVGASALARTERFAEASEETRDAILDEAAKLAEEALAPVNRAGDLHPARLENGVVRCPPGFAEAYAKIIEGGWVGISAGTAFGGMGLPICFQSMVGEMMCSANMALSLCPLLSQGQIEAMEHHASDSLKALYLPKLTSGEWTGTMNLTEPQAGSDVGALITKAEPNSDGTYAISGQKIYITWGDHDVAENVCHLVLARLPDGQPGTRGISLFLVPKLIPDAEGRPGVTNSLRVVSLENKLGIHGSPTCVMEYERATGWLVGAEHGGMAAMFTMMNNARLGVGIQGVAIAEAATQRAVAYAAERKQGRTADGTPSILGHADVRRMVLEMKVLTQAARAICLDCAFSLDMARAAETAEGREAHEHRAAFLTPIAKAFGTDAGCEVAHIGVQVHGGMGFIEETGAAQLSRDVRITPIYEGTNGVQALDLIGRKLADGGKTARALLAEISGTTGACGAAGAPLADLVAPMRAAEAALAKVTEFMLGAGMKDRSAGATPYLRIWALALGAHYLAKGALADPESLERRTLLQFFVLNRLPEASALTAAAMQGADLLYALDAEALAS